MFTLLVWKSVNDDFADTVFTSMRLLSAKRSINDINRSDGEKNLIKTLFDRYLLSNIELLNAIKVQTT